MKLKWKYNKKEKRLEAYRGDHTFFVIHRCPERKKQKYCLVSPYWTDIYFHRLSSARRVAELIQNG
jgi:hypothetical protein